MYATVKLGKRTDFQHLFHGTFRDNLTLPLPVFHHHRHPPTGEIEGYLIHLLIIVFQVFQRKFLHVRKDGLVHQVLESGLEETVEIGMTQNAFFRILTTVGIDVFLQHNLVAGQGTGLVGTQDIHCPEILDGIQVFHDGLFFRHGQRSFRKVGRYNHREHFGSQPHGYRYGKDESLQPVAFGKSVYQENERNHHQHEAHQQETYFADTFIKSCGRPMSGNATGYGSQIGLVTGCQHDSDG